MKKNILIFFSTLLFILGFSSCSSGYDDFEPRKNNGLVKEKLFIYDSQTVETSYEKIYSSWGFEDDDDSDYYPGSGGGSSGDSSDGVEPDINPIVSKNEISSSVETIVTTAEAPFLYFGDEYFVMYGTVTQEITAEVTTKKYEYVYKDGTSIENEEAENKLISKKNLKFNVVNGGEYEIIETYDYFTINMNLDRVYTEVKADEGVSNGFGLSLSDCSSSFIWEKNDETDTKLLDDCGFDDFYYNSIKRKSRRCILKNKMLSINLREEFQYDGPKGNPTGEWVTTTYASWKETTPDESLKGMRVHFEKLIRRWKIGETPFELEFFPCGHGEISLSTAVDETNSNSELVARVYFEWSYINDILILKETSGWGSEKVKSVPLFKGKLIYNQVEDAFYDSDGNMVLKR